MSQPWSDNTPLLLSERSLPKPGRQMPDLNTSSCFLGFIAHYRKDHQKYKPKLTNVQTRDMWRAANPGTITGPVLEVLVHITEQSHLSNYCQMPSWFDLRFSNGTLEVLK